MYLTKFSVTRTVLQNFPFGFKFVILISTYKISFPTEIALNVHISTLRIRLFVFKDAKLLACQAGLALSSILYLFDLKCIYYFAVQNCYTNHFSRCDFCCLFKG